MGGGGGGGERALTMTPARQPAQRGKQLIAAKLPNVGPRRSKRTPDSGRGQALLRKVGERLHLHLAAHAVRGAHLADLHPLVHIVHIKICLLLLLLVIITPCLFLVLHVRVATLGFRRCRRCRRRRRCPPPRLPGGLAAAGGACYPGTLSLWQLLSYRRCPAESCSSTTIVAEAGHATTACRSGMHV